MKAIARDRLYTTLFYGILAGIFIASILTMTKTGIDIYILHSAGRQALLGHNPYQLPEPVNFYTPIWSLLLLSPLSLFPLSVAQIIWTFTGLVAWIFILRRLGIRTLDASLYALNPFFLAGIMQGNYEWLVLLGLLVPMQYGAWFLFLKPQASLGYLLWWTKESGTWKAIRFFTLPIVVLEISFLFGLYRAPVLSEMAWNRSLWPFGIPIGLYLLWMSFRNSDELMALASTPFFSPYVAIQTWTIPFLLLTKKRWALIAGLILSWAWVFYDFLI